MMRRLGSLVLAWCPRPGPGTESSVSALAGNLRRSRLRRATPARQARPQQIGGHRPAERRLRHSRRQPGGRRCGDAHGTAHLSVRQGRCGETNIFVFGPNGEQIASLDLAVERDVAGLEDYLKRFIPTSTIKVELLNDNVVLTGTVDTPLDAKRAAIWPTIFVTGGEATTGQYSQTAAGGSVNGGVAINNPDAERAG